MIWKMLEVFVNHPMTNSHRMISKTKMPPPNSGMAFRLIYIGLRYLFNCPFNRFIQHFLFWWLNEF